MPSINRKHKIREKPTPYAHHTKASAQYYHNSLWTKLAQWYKKHHPFCERCEAMEKTTPATQVHHKIPFMKGITDEDKWKLLLDEDNLMSVCDQCHVDIHNEMNGRKKKTTNLFDDEDNTNNQKRNTT